MNCSKCISRQVCKLQEEIRLLSYKMVTKPFYEDDDVGITVGRQQEIRITRRLEIYYKLKGVISSYCPLYLESS